METLEQLRAERDAAIARAEKAERERDNLRDCWDLTCGQIGSMCVRLGADEGNMVDAWMLRDLIERVIRKVERAEARVRALEKVAEAAREVCALAPVPPPGCIRRLAAIIDALDNADGKGCGT